MPIVVREFGDRQVSFRCPGCGEVHGINVDPGRRPRWTWNGRLDKPTFTPSILVRTTKSDLTDEQLDEVMEMLDRGERERTLEDHRFKVRCHSFVTDGNIRFLDDCSHELAGKTVPLQEFDD